MAQGLSQGKRVHEVGGMKEALPLFLYTEATGCLQEKSETGRWSPLVQQSGRERGGEQEREGQQ